MSIKPEVLELSEALEKELIIDTATGEGKEEGLYLKHLPEGLTPEIDKAVDEYRTTFVAAGTHAFGKLAVNAMNDNSNLNSANVIFDIGHKNKLTVGVQRCAEFTKPGTDEKVVRFGAVSAKYETHGATNAGELKKVRMDIAELASGMIGK